MATIVLRSTKGSALTFQEGDDNFNNLNTDKLEDLTNESIGDLSDVDITTSAPTHNQGLVWDSANNKFVVGDVVSSLSGTVTAVDDAITPNTITVDTYDGIEQGNEIIFAGADCTTVGVTAGQVYYIVAITSPGTFEISTSAIGSPIALTNPNPITDFTYTAFPTGSSGAVGALGDLSDVTTTVPPSDGDVLIYNGVAGEWGNVAPFFLESLADDPAPTLSGLLDGVGNRVTDIQLDNYKETIYSLGTSDAPDIDVANGNVQSVSILLGLTLPAFTNAEAGQSVTLLVSGSGTASGTTGHLFAGGNTTLTTSSVVSIFYDGTTYWTSIATDFQ